MVIQIALVFICFVLAGCDLRGTADCRFADSIQVWTQTTTGRPDRSELDSSGYATVAANNFYAQYVCDGEPLETSGMPMTILEASGKYAVSCGGSSVAYYPSTEVAWNFRDETNDDGILECELKRDYMTRDYYNHQVSIRFGHPNKPNDVWSCFNASYSNRFDPIENDIMQYMAVKTVNYRGFPETIYGGYFWSGTQPMARKYMANAAVPDTNICPIPINPPAKPDFGVVLASVSWERAKADGFSSVKHLVASMTADPIKLSNMEPYRFTAVLRCAEPIYANGAVLTGKYIVNQPDGRKLTYDANSVVVASGEYLKVRSSGVLTVEPYCWKNANGTLCPPDPYMLDDVLIVPVKLNFLGGPGTTVTYEITGIDGAASMPVLSNYWLSNNKTLDKNHDGIVNLRDI